MQIHSQLEALGSHGAHPVLREKAPVPRSSSEGKAVNGEVKRLESGATERTEHHRPPSPERVRDALVDIGKFFRDELRDLERSGSRNEVRDRVVDRPLPAPEPEPEIEVEEHRLRDEPRLHDEPRTPSESERISFLRAAGERVLALLERIQASIPQLAGSTGTEPAGTDAGSNAAPLGSGTVVEAATGESPAAVETEPTPAPNPFSSLTPEHQAFLHEVGKRVLELLQRIHASFSGTPGTPGENAPGAAPLASSSVVEAPAGETLATAPAAAKPSSPSNPSNPSNIVAEKFGRNIVALLEQIKGRTSPPQSYGPHRVGGLQITLNLSVVNVVS